MQCHWLEVLGHPLHSPALLAGLHYGADVNIKHKTWLLAIRVEPTCFYCMGVAYLTAWCAKYINKRRDYIEKWQKYVTCLSRNIPLVP